MEGCSAPLVVKFADTQKDKEQKKMQQIHANLFSSTNVSPTAIPLTGFPSPNSAVAASVASNNLNSIMNSISTTCSSTAASPTGGGLTTTTSSPIAANLAPTATALTSNSSLLTNPPQLVNPFIGSDAITTSSLQLLQHLQAVGLQQQFLQGLTFATSFDHFLSFSRPKECLHSVCSLQRFISSLKANSVTSFSVSFEVFLLFAIQMEMAFEFENEIEKIINRLSSFNPISL